jgi:hypothetical protein
VVIFPDATGGGRPGDARFCGARPLPLSGVGRSGVPAPPKPGISSSFKSSSLSSLKRLCIIFGSLAFPGVFTHLLGCIGSWLFEEWMPSGSGWVAEAAKQPFPIDHGGISALGWICLVSIGTDASRSSALA